jgi:hypothetical protein
MAIMNTYLMVHNNPDIDCEEVQARWRKIATDKAGKWVKSYVNEGQNTRYCIWMASDIEDLKNIFTELGISWESIIQVDEIVPDMWGEKWQEHLEIDATADTLGD